MNAGIIISDTIRNVATLCFMFVIASFFILITKITGGLAEIRLPLCYLNAVIACVFALESPTLIEDFLKKRFTLMFFEIIIMMLLIVVVIMVIGTDCLPV